jgi:hypothetical protein
MGFGLYEWGKRNAYGRELVTSAGLASLLGHTTYVVGGVGVKGKKLVACLLLAERNSFS